jgi:Tol biopolymer transport system component/subtilisin family serine protease
VLQYKEGELLVKFKQGVSSTSKQAVNTSIGASVLKEFSFIGWQHVQLPQGMSVAQGIADYKQMENVVAAEPNYAVQLASVPNDPLFGNQYGLQKIQAPTAWNTTTGSSNVVIAVLDTGVDYNHPDLAANMWHNPGETPGNNIDDDNNGYVDDVYGIDPSNGDSDPIDDAGHGTTCAGVLGAVGNNNTGVAGVNWSVKIMAIKIFYNSNTGFVSEVIKAFEYVTMMKNRGVNIRATSNSWRWWFGQFSQSVKDSIDAAGDAGVANVFASGNDFISETICTPAGCRDLHSIDLDFAPTFGAAWDSPSILSIASSNETDNLSVFAGYGRKSVDLAAPGENIWTTSAGGNYGLASGTSLSTPFVAGAIGLLSAHDSSLSVSSLKATLNNTVDTFPDFADKTVSGGRLNVAQALASPTVCTFSVSPTSLTFSANAGTGRIDVSSGTNCNFAGRTTDDFITILSGAGTGNGPVEFSVTANTTGNERSGTITVAGQTVNVVQAAAVAESCVTFEPESESFGANGGDGEVEIVAGRNCEFELAAASDDFWISNVLANQNNVVTYTVEQNVGPERTGTILIANKNFTVTQDSGCAYTFSPTERNLQAAGGSTNVKVYASNSLCAWTPVSNASWLHINYVASGGTYSSSAVGDGLVYFNVDTNNTGVDRTGGITIGDQTYVVTQGHCSYSFSPGSAFIPKTGSNGSFTITTTSGCPWSVSTVSDWIHITSVTSGTGNATVNYTVDENLTAAYRSGLIYVGEQFASTAVINPSQFVQIDQDNHLPGKIAYSTNADGDSEIYVMNNDGSNQTRLTNNTAYDDAPAWSPDGSKIAFESNASGQINIYVMNADGSNQTQLTTTSGSDVYPAWSPDGTKIAFTSFRNGNSQIYVMNADGSNQTRLTNNSAYDNFPSWSPNGSQLTFSSNRTGALQIYTMNADGSNQVAITATGVNHAPAWSPNGRWIAYMSQDISGNFGLSLYDTAFSLSRVVTSGTGGSDLFPQWSPDGSKLVFQSTRDGNNEIYYARFFDGAFPVRLTSASTSEAKPAWQPVPAKVAFTTTRDSGNYEIYLMNPDGSTQINLTNDAGTDTGPTWSPDGMKLAFASQRSGSQSQDIYTVRSDGTNPTNLTNSASSDVSPAWSPDGSKIAFASFRDGNSEVYVMNADGSSQVNLTNNSAFDSSPTWSPDGAKIAFATTRDGTLQIYVMNADGSNQTRLTNNSANDHFPSWSPDGKKIAFASDRNGAFQIYVMNANGTNQTRLTNNSSSDLYPQWSSPDGSKIVFSTNRDGNSEIYIMKADGSNHTNLSNNSGFDYGPVWRPQ